MSLAYLHDAHEPASAGLKCFFVLCVSALLAEGTWLK